MPFRRFEYFLVASGLKTKNSLEEVIPIGGKREDSADTALFSTITYAEIGYVSLTKTINNPMKTMNHSANSCVRENRERFLYLIYLHLY